MPKVVLKSEVATAPDLLWRAIREFGALDRWNPRVHALDSEGDAIGSTRKVEVEGVGVFVERL